MARPLAREDSRDGRAGAFAGHSEEKRVASVQRIRQVVLAASLLSCMAAHANLVVNGSFESGAPIPAFPPFISPVAGSTAITGWQITAGNVDYGVNGNGFWAASNGARSLDMNGNAAGTIAQLIATEIGREYEVLFDLAGNFYGGLAIKPLRVTAGGTSRDYTFDTTGRSANDMGWSTRSFVFVASSSSTLLSFASLDINEGASCSNANLGGGRACFGAALDNVRMDVLAPANPTPAPGTLALAALGLAGLAAAAGGRRPAT